MFAEGHSDRAFFERLIQQCMGRPLKLRIYTGGMDTSEDSGNVGSNDNQRLRLYKQAQNHPMLKSLLETFDADIVAREPFSREEWLKKYTNNEGN